jgi:hypothetical protein
MYRYETFSIESFIQQLAVCYISNGYWYYVTGVIPEHKDPRKTDAKILQQYSIGISKWARSRKKRSGEAKVQYLRLGRFFVIVATTGRHLFFEREGLQIKDFRCAPLLFAGYSISCKPGSAKAHVSVQIAKATFLRLKKHFQTISTQHTVEDLIREFRAFPFEAYAPLKKQLLRLYFAVNARRKVAGLAAVPWDALVLRRRMLSPFKSHAAVEGE